MEFQIVSEQEFYNDLLDTVLRKNVMSEGRAESHKKAKENSIKRRKGKKRGKYEYNGVEWSVK